MAEPTIEKVIRLETQMTNAVSELGEVKSLVKELIVKVDNFGQLQNEIATLKNEIGNLKTDLVAVKKRSTVVAWIYPTLSAVVTAIFVLLLTAYLHGSIEKPVVVSPPSTTTTTTQTK